MSYAKVILSAAALLLLSYLYRSISAWQEHRALSKLHGCKAPRAYKHRDPIFGFDGLLASLRAIKASVYLKRQRDLYAEYGTTYESIMNGGRVINTIEPNNIKAVFSAQFDDFGAGAKRRAAFAPLLDTKHSVFQLDGDSWRGSRRSLRPYLAVTPPQLLPIFEQHYQALLAELPDGGSSRTEVDLQPLFLRFSLDAATSWLFGASTNLLKNRSSAGEAFFSALHSAQHGCEVRWQSGALASLMQGRNFPQDIATVKAYVKDKLPPDAAHRLLYGKDAPPFSPSEDVPDNREASLHPQLLTLVIAATDTVAAVLTCLVHGLARHPEAWRQVRKEVLATVGPTSASAPIPTTMQVRQLKYLHWCIYESLRLWPVLVSNSRIAERATVLPAGGGADGRAPVLVRRGDTVSVGFAALYRREDLWGADAAEFRPERWAELEGSELRWCFLPFSRGPRICPGRDIAIIEVAFVMARLAQAFDRFEPAEDRPWVEQLGMACTSKYGAKVILQPASAVDDGKVGQGEVGSFSALWT